MRRALTIPAATGRNRYSGLRPGRPGTISIRQRRHSTRCRREQDNRPAALVRTRRRHPSWRHGGAQLAAASPGGRISPISLRPSAAFEIDILLYWRAIFDYVTLSIELRRKL